MSDKLRYIRQNADWGTDDEWQESPSDESLQGHADRDPQSAAKHPPGTMLAGPDRVKPSRRRNRSEGSKRRKAGRPVKRTSMRPHRERLHVVDAGSRGVLSDAIDEVRPHFREDDVLKARYLLGKGLHQVSTLVTMIGGKERAWIALLALVDRGELRCRADRLNQQSWVSLRS